MAKLTIIVDDELLRHARMRASEQGTSVQAILRRHLEAYAGNRDSLARAGADIVRLARTSTASSQGRRWTRDDIYD